MTRERDWDRIIREAVHDLRERGWRFKRGAVKAAIRTAEANALHDPRASGAAQVLNEYASQRPSD